jgi:hypothetical protein
MICVTSLPVDVRCAFAIPAPARQGQKRIPLDPPFPKGEATSVVTSPPFAKGGQGGFAFPTGRRRQSRVSGDLNLPKVQAP